MSNIKLALAIRGHIRDSFSNKRMRRFCKNICSNYDTDVYIHTWNKYEASNGHRPGELFENFKEKKVKENHILEYFEDCSNNIEKIIIDNDKEIKHFGTIGGKVCESSCPRLCWKNYWYGKYRVYNTIKESKKNYNLVISIRIDNFVNKYSKKSNIIETIIFDKLETTLKNISEKPLKQLIMFSHKIMYGIDNCYFGPVNVMYKLGKYFHQELDKITTKYKGRAVTSQEWLLLLEANTVNEEEDASILLPHQIRRRRNKEIHKLIEERAKKRRIYNQNLRKRARLIQRERKVLDNRTRDILLDRMKRRKEARKSRIMALRQAAKDARVRRAERLKNS